MYTVPARRKQRWEGHKFKTVLDHKASSKSDWGARDPDKTYKQQQEQQNELELQLSSQSACQVSTVPRIKFSVLYKPDVRPMLVIPILGGDGEKMIRA